MQENYAKYISIGQQFTDRRMMTLEDQNISDIELKTYAKTNKHANGLKLRLNEPVKTGLDIEHKDKGKAIIEHDGKRTEEVDVTFYDTATGVKVYVPVEPAHEIDRPVGEVVKLYILEVNPTNE